MNRRSHSETHNYRSFAQEYGTLGAIDTFFLAYRDVPALINKYVIGRSALDHGCGAGRSTRFLKSQGFDVIGVDRSQDMLQEAKLRDPAGHYRLITDSKLSGIETSSLDLVFQSIVFLEYSSKKRILQTVKEFHRVLRPAGTAIVVVTSEYGLKNDWASFICSHPENQDLKSGDLAKTMVRGTGVEFQDYYWTDSDYREVFDSAGFWIVDRLEPLADGSEPFQWISEIEKPNWTIYVLKKMTPRS